MIMEKKKFDFWNRIVALVILVISGLTYLSTIEPGASFWDCGEFIASSYKLEVGHPPGNPVFQLFARFFTIFGNNLQAPVLVNSLSAICSALTIFFLYLTIVFFLKRLVKKGDNGNYTVGGAITIFGSAAVGALAYCFSDTFWFSAVEGEVYAMSSLFTAMVFWAMTKWYEQADQPYANRWIVLISFLMGLSIGVHLLNLLAIPALVFMYYYRMREDATYTLKEYVKIFLISVLILAFLVFLLIPYLPKVAAYVDLFFVNVLGLPYNSGAAFFMLALLGLCFWGMFSTLKKKKVFWNTVLLCCTTILVGFSLFSIIIIRSSAKTPTNEYQPDNAFTLVRYLSREQYGSNPLIYGQYFDAPTELYTPKYWAPLNGKYKRVDGPLSAKYTSEGKMLFPRMWSNADANTIAFYETYTGGKGKAVAGAEHRKPTMHANLTYFFDYQLNWMYWRYFMWNFAGRQNDIHSPNPGDIFYGNWESGIGFLDKFRLGDQSDAPELLSGNKGKNHYFLLPLLLGLIGLFFQFNKDRRGCWLVFLMFFMTGIAIVIYLNQPPFQVRERDYAYAGSFYAFSIWIGFAVAAIVSGIQQLLKGKQETVSAVVATAACLCVPVLMAAQNWDDHNRSNRNTALEMAYNYLNSVGDQGILVTHGDNDTFPLWYAQEVEEVRNDVRIVNTSLLGTDWYIDQMKYAVNESKPLPLTVGQEQYLYGTNEYVYIYDSRETVTSIKDVMAVFKHPEAKLQLSGNRKADYICSRKISIPVNRDNVLKYGILPVQYADVIPDEIIIEIPQSKEYLTKPELFMLDFLAGYQWDRPLNLLNQGGDINIGIKDYLMYEGYSYKFVPIRNKIGHLDVGKVDAERLYRLMTEVYTFDAVKRQDYYVDYQNFYTNLGVMSLRSLFVNVAGAFMKEGQYERALEMLDKCRECVPETTYPIETIPLGFSGNDYMVIQMVEYYYQLGEKDKARELGIAMANDLMVSSRFYLEFYDLSQSDFELCANYVYLLADTFREGGDAALAGKLLDNLSRLVDFASGKIPTAKEANENIGDLTIEE